MQARHVLTYLAAAGAALAPLGCGRGVTVLGAGATFPAPLYKRWMREYYLRHPDVRVSYQPIGSGAGIRQFTEGLTDFGASDAFMSDDEIKLFHETKRPHRNEGLLQVPLTAGSVVLCYNVPGVGPGLRLTRKAYVDIFLGKITSWDDKAIKDVNPDVELPGLPITVVRRAESSGTTAAFTGHLNAIDPRWKKDRGGPGAGKSINWPTGIGARGNDGVAALIDQTPGAIGYIEYGYADLAQLPMADLQNRKGLPRWYRPAPRFIRPTPESGRLSLAVKKIPDDFKVVVPDPDEPGGYPIVTYTWVLLYRKYENAQTAATLKAVLRYCLTDGQAIAADLGYIPLPKDLIDKALKAVESIEP
jgi:phosphate transport system substrate-binding protein